MVALHIRIPLLNYKHQELARKPATLTGTWVQGTSEQNIIAKLNKEKHVIGSHIFSHFVGHQICCFALILLWIATPTLQGLCLLIWNFLFNMIGFIFRLT